MVISKVSIIVRDQFKPARLQIRILLCKLCQSVTQTKFFIRIFLINLMRLPKILNFINFNNNDEIKLFFECISSICSIVYVFRFLHPPPHASLFISIIVSHIFQIFHISNFLDIVPFPIFQICILPIFSIPYHSLCLSSKYKINIPFFTRMNFSNFRNRRKLIKF